MKLYILRWNPAFSSWTYEQHASLLQAILDNDFDGMNWSIYNFENLEEGDLWILQQVGTDKDGIAAFGTFTSGPYTAPSWKKKDGTNLFYADMYFDCIIDRRKTDFLSAAEFEKLVPEIDWHRGHSGVLVESETAEKLVLNLVEKTAHLRKPTEKIAFEQVNDGDMIEGLERYLSELCPKFKSKVIKEKKMIYRDFKAGESIEDAFVELEFDAERSKNLNENCGEEELLQALDPVA